MEEIVERICPICGKLFVLSPDHVYRDKRTKKRARRPYVCSYHCMLISERMEEDRKKGRRIKANAKKDNRPDNA